MFTEVTVPHCIIEYSNTLDGEALISKVFAGALDSELFDVNGEDIKVRAIGYSNYQTGRNKTDFVHVTLKVLDGRSSELKSRLSQLVLVQLKELALSNCSITIEVVDMERNSYSKLVM